MISQRTRSIRVALLIATLLPLCLGAEVWAQSGRGTIRWNDALDQAPTWYASVEAVRIADNVLLYQHETGGWPKNIDMARVLSEADRARIREEQAAGGTTLSNITIDNGATYTQMRYLARVYAATGLDRFKEGVLHGLDYLREAQYERGGWPQYYPLREGYYSRITFNDGAMIGALGVLRDVAAGGPPFAFVPADHRAEAKAALARGIDAVLRMQIRQNGRLAAWCAQYDEETLKPAWARDYEPPSLSGAESVSIVRFLLSLEDPSPAIVAAVEGAIAWFRDVAIHGYRFEELVDAEGREDRRIVRDPNAGPLWARFYELVTNRPIFLDRDSVFRYALSEIGQERRAGYCYYGGWAEELLAEEYPAWRARHDLPALGALDGYRHRVVVSTDIGGTDPDDFQSMVHLLLYADVLAIEGLISSPYGPGRKEHILEVIDHYEQDYPNLKNHASRYPSPDALRSITKQGAVDRAGYHGVGEPTEGSAWIIERARADDPRPLHVLVWGGLEDLAQALHDAPDILPKLRVYWIGGPNKKWSPDAYQYIADHHSDLWIIEANATYRGWFVGGNQSAEWSNSGFVDEHVAGHGSLGDFFATQLGGTIKMGDTPSVGWLLKGTPGDPSQPGWGGRFVRAWDRPYDQFDRMTTRADRMQAFGILELALPLGTDVPDEPEAWLEVDNQALVGHLPGDGTVRFRFSPKGARTYAFTIRSNVPALDGKTGGIAAITPPSDAAQRPSAAHPNWWTDDPSPQLAEDGHIGVQTVNRWREEFLRDFAECMDRADAPQP